MSQDGEEMMNSAGRDMRYGIEEYVHGLLLDNNLLLLLFEHLHDEKFKSKIMCIFICTYMLLKTIF